MKPRDNSVDIAKAIAMICVVIGHLGDAKINSVVFTFHIPIFYLITGYYLYGIEKKDFKLVLKNKVRTLIVPYYISCIAIIVLCIPKALYFGDNVKETIIYWVKASIYAAGDCYNEPFEIIGIGAIWFLWATFWGSIFMYFILKMKSGNRIAVILVLFTACYWSRRLFWFPLSIQAGGCSVLFMYIGWMYRNEQEWFNSVKKETKAFFTVIAAAAWIWFMRHFYSFWLVHCDVGRGIIDIIASICGCYCIILISKYIEHNISFLGKPLAYLGRYSLIMLSLHIIELNLFPYWKLFEVLSFRGFNMKYNTMLYIKIIIKMIFIIIGTVVISKIRPLRKVYGYKE